MEGQRAATTVGGEGRGGEGKGGEGRGGEGRKGERERGGGVGVWERRGKRGREKGGGKRCE